MVEGSMVNLELLLPWIRHAQVSGTITSQIAALRASPRKLDEVISKISHLEHVLTEWYDALPSFLKIDTKTSEIPAGLDPVHVINMQYGFLYGMIVIHSLLAHPWNVPAMKISAEEVSEFESRAAQSMKIVVDSSRQIIRKLRHVVIDVCAPKW
jgi:hypothetical protein